MISKNKELESANDDESTVPSAPKYLVNSIINISINKLIIKPFFFVKPKLFLYKIYSSSS